MFIHNSDIKALLTTTIPLWFDAIRLHHDHLKTYDQKINVHLTSSYEMVNK